MPSSNVLVKRGLDSVAQRTLRTGVQVDFVSEYGESGANGFEFSCG